MHRTTGLLLAASLSVMGTAAFAQQPNPQTPEESFTTRDLIAWSSLQKPQPAPQPLPPRDTPIPQPEPQDQQPKPPADPQTQQEPVQSFTGRIVKDGARFVLKVANNATYQLDGGGSLQRYENQNVRIEGHLDPGTATIHIVKIDLLS
jgi:hypothetical protein